MKTFLANLNHAIRNNETVTIGGGQFTPADLRVISLQLEALQESQAKGWELAKSLQVQVNILKPVVENVAADDDEYGLGPDARKALEALTAHKET